MTVYLLSYLNVREQLLLRHTEHYVKGRLWVGSRRLENSYLESVPTSELGATTDVRQAPRQEHAIASVLLGSAIIGHSAHMRTAPFGAAAINKNVASYAFLCLAIPIRPSKPEPNSHIAAGTGTALTSPARTAHPLVVTVLRKLAWTPRRKKNV
jgi:hypothetical protein